MATDTPTSVCLAMLLVARESSLDESVPVIGGGRKVVDLLPILLATISTTRDVHRKTPTSTSAKIIRLLHLDTRGIENNRHDNRREGVELDLSPECELFYLRVDVNGSVVKARLLWTSKMTVLISPASSLERTAPISAASMVPVPSASASLKALAMSSIPSSVELAWSARTMENCEPKM